MKTRITVSVTALLLISVLATGCSQAETTPTPEPTQSTTPTPAPTTPEPTTPAIPDAEEYDGTVVLQDENGVITLPNGEVADCPTGTKGAFINKEGVVSCDTGADW